MAALPGMASADSDHGRPGDGHHDQPKRDFDLQAHRGGAALVAESTLPAFANALELGVSTLELDIAITKDGKAVVSHDRKIDAPQVQGHRARLRGRPPSSPTWGSTSRT